MKKYSKKRGPVRAKKVSFDGIQFQSGLELYMYKALKEAKIVGEYEPVSYTLLEGFDFEGICFEKQANGKGEYKDRGCKKILPIKYKPDFVGRDFIIECKGRANESFPLRWKLFKHWIALRSPNVALFKPQNQKDCDYTIKQIELMRSNLRINATKNPLASKHIARTKYKERKIDTYIKWTTEKRGYLLWKDLVNLHNKYNIKVY